MTQAASDCKLSDQGARAIHETFIAYRTRFMQITRRAQSRFIDRDWQAMRTDATRRLELYREAVDHIEADIRQLLANRVQDKRIWANIKTAYSSRLISNDNWELAETFFNSITRRIFSTVGVDSNIEFVDTIFGKPPGRTMPECFRTFENQLPNPALIKRILADYPWMTSFQNFENDARQAADKIETYLQKLGSPGKIERIDIVRSIFFRGMGAYIVGRIYAGSERVPLAIALLNSTAFPFCSLVFRDI